MSKTLILSVLIGAGVYCLPAAGRTAASAKSDEAFLATAAQADMTIVHMGKMAQERAETPSLKDFANTLVQDHTNDYQELTELASKAGHGIPKVIDKHNDRTIATLDHYKGKTFDHAFLETQAAEHERLVSAFKREAEHGSNPDVKAYANKALPTIEQHLHDVENLLKQKG
jgi:putative membrane protein